MKSFKYNISLDKLELTYQASQQVRDALAAIKESKVINEITIVRVEKPQHYQHEFLLFGKDYSVERGEYIRAIGVLFFGSLNENRQHIYISYNNAALYDTYLLASRFYVEEALNLHFYRVSKIDIALDLNRNVITRFYRLYRDEAYSLVILNKRYKDLDESVKEVLHISTGTRKRPFKNRSFYIENKDKSLALRCYNKSEELTDSEKEYIPNVSGKLPMYRLEVSLANHKNVAKSLSQLGVFDADEVYSKLQNEEFLFSLFLTTLDRLIRVGKGRKGYNLLECLLQ